MLDPHITAEIQALRVKLHDFGSQQRDPAVQFYCLAVESNLAEALERDDPMLREVLASSVHQPEKALLDVRLASPRAEEPDHTRSFADAKTPNPGASLVNRITVMLQR
jgi:hypothetical protein